MTDKSAGMADKRMGMPPGVDGCSDTTPMNIQALLHGFRYLDTLFPSGGFAFSSGLETAVQEGSVHTSEDLNRYVADYLWWGLGKCEAVALAQGHRAAFNRDLKGIIRADRALEAMKLCRETRMAGRQMGRSLFQNAIRPESSAHGILDAFREAVDSGRSPGHWAVILGVSLYAAGWNRQGAVAGFLYQAATGFVSSSYKLLSIGQREGQRLLEAWTPLIVEISHTVDAGAPMTSWTPLQDIYAMRHARLTTRLFRS